MEVFDKHEQPKHFPPQLYNLGVWFQEMFIVFCVFIYFLLITNLTNSKLFLKEIINYMHISQKSANRIRVKLGRRHIPFVSLSRAE